MMIINNRKVYFVICIILLLYCTSPAWSASWYASASGSGTRDGLSPENAWKGPKWASIEPGDTVYLIGEFTVIDCYAHGSTDNYITMTGYDENAMISNSLELWGSDWLKITNLTINGTITQDGGYSDYLWLDHLIIDCGGSGTGIRFLEADNCRVSYCTITNGTDGIWTGAWREGPEHYITIDHCIISDMSGGRDSHCIGLEGGLNCLIEYNDLSYANTGVTCYGNYINDVVIRYNHVHDMDGTRATGGIDYQRGYGIGFEGNVGGAWATRTGNYVYNNIVHDCTGVEGAYIPASGIRAKFYDNTNYIYNNTVYNCSPNFEISTMKIGDVWQPIGGILKNNISMLPNSSSGSQYQSHIYCGSYAYGYTGLEINNNLYYPDSINAFIFGDISYTLSGWQSVLASAGISGADSYSICEDPLFYNLSGTLNFAYDYVILESSSPIIDSGDNSLLSGKVNCFDYSGSLGLTDSSGSIIAPGGIVDIGAFEVPKYENEIDSFVKALFDIKAGADEELMMFLNSTGNTWYVSESGSGLKDGTSPVNAMERINVSSKWDTLKPGDTLCIIGAVDSLDVNGNGLAENYINIKGYNENASIGEVSFNNSSWVKLSHLTVENSVQFVDSISEHIWIDHVKVNNGGIKLHNCSNVRLSYCTVSGSGISSDSLIGGADNDITIDHCIVTDINNTSNNYCIEIDGANNWTIEYNELSYANVGIILYGDSVNNNVIRYNNIHDMKASRVIDASNPNRGYGIGFEGNLNAGKTRTGNYVYGNLIYSCAGKKGSLVPAAGIKAQFYDNTNYIFNNTVHDCSPNYEITWLSIGNVQKPIGGNIKNNISYFPNDTSGAKYKCHIYSEESEAGFSGLEINNNLYYPDKNGIFNIGNNGYNFKNWNISLISRGVTVPDSYSSIGEPGFLNLSGTFVWACDYLILEQSSPVVDSGTNSAWSGLMDLFDFSGSLQLTNSTGTVVAPGGIVDIGALEVPKDQDGIEPFVEALLGIRIGADEELMF